MEEAKGKNSSGGWQGRAGGGNAVRDSHAQATDCGDSRDCQLAGHYPAHPTQGQLQRSAAQRHTGEGSSAWRRARRRSAGQGVAGCGGAGQGRAGRGRTGRGRAAPLTKGNEGKVGGDLVGVEGGPLGIRVVPRPLAAKVRVLKPLCRQRAAGCACGCRRGLWTQGHTRSPEHTGAAERVGGR